MSDLISRAEAKDAIDMALDHIDHVPSWVYDNLLNALNEVPSVKPTHSTPSNTLGALDCVDRAEVIKAVKFYETFYDPYPRVIEALEKLPSVQPEIIRCKDCRYSIDEYGDGECYYKRPSRELVWIGKRWDFFCAAARLKMEVEHDIH